MAILERYDKLMGKMEEFDKELFEIWAKAVPSQIEENLNQPLIRRSTKSNELFLNFHPQMSAILREVHYLNLMEMENLPEAALKMAANNEMYRKYISSLNATIEWYNRVRKHTRDVEFQLVKDEVLEIDKLIVQGETVLTWQSENLWEYLTKIHTLVGDLQKRIQETQENLSELQNILWTISKQPLFERKDGKKDTVLGIEDRVERATKKYSEVSQAAVKISELIGKNKELFEMGESLDPKLWEMYVDFVDGLVEEYLYKAVGCSLGYISEHMDSINNLSPLFEAQLELQEPELVFIPSLDEDPKGFHAILTNLITDIIQIAANFPRLSTTRATYLEEIQSHKDISEMKTEITCNVQKVMSDAMEFCDSFQTYSYFWLDNKDTYLKNFLLYSRQLTPDEMDLVYTKDSLAPKHSPPKMEHFREQIDLYETVFGEVEGMKTEQIFHSWFKVDIRPFKHALLNTVRKWGNMFKDHLVNNVTNSLCDLAEFIRKADEGLQQTVNEGDYSALVNVMGFLLEVKERQQTTDEMFGPLRDTIELLKFYDQDIPEQVNVFLQVRGEVRVVITEGFEGL